MQREGFSDDLPYAQRTAAALGVDLHTVVVGPEMATLFPEMVYQLDEPLADPAAVNVFLISQLAKQQGVKVLLSGAGGDDLFAGYRRHQAIRAERYWSWLPHPARRALARSLGTVAPRTPSLRRLGKAFRYADLDGDARLASYFIWTPQQLEHGLLSPTLRDNLAGRSAAEPFVNALAGLPEGTDPLQKMLYLDGKFFLPDHNLTYTDKMSMACGVEVRVPFMDRDLIALAASLPGRLKQRGQVGKWVLREAVRPMLPKEVLTRSKTGFGVPARQWLSHDLREMVDDLLSDASVAKRGLFDAEGVAQLLQLDRGGRIDGAYPIFSMMTMELWCRQFIDSPLPRPVGSA
jgi:asparagine synthase (glutamine-hydrolysing)